MRNVVQRALEQEFPDFADYEAADTPTPDPQKTTIEAEAAPEPDPQKTTIEEWTPRRLTGPGDPWGAALVGPSVAELPDNDKLCGTPIRVTDKRGESWPTTITEVVERTDTTIVVKNSGRPRS